ncbi:MAG: pantetheine-phosphate adenylyltransferase [Candidatus Izimaplasma sp.]|nr:pantetheine-phosphate adenylyltransferase [Candidatus Izimaplasma bacterium]
MSIAVYPGSFDPITYGHMDIAERALKVFDELVILVSTNPKKKALFSPEERIDMITETLSKFKDRIRVCTSNNLTVRQTKALDASHIIRGLRAVTDFEYEFEMAHANRVLDRTVDSIYFMTDSKYIFLASSTVKEIAQYEGDLSQFVPTYVEQQLKQKMK